MTIDAWIIQAAARTPHKCAIEFHDQALSYQQFAELISVRAAQLTDQGIGRGDRIGWLGFNHPEVFVLLFAAARLGAMLVPLNWRLSDVELATILADCAPRLVFHDDDMGARANDLAPVQAQAIWPQTHDLAARDLPDSASKSDPLMIVYTSGSTGTPKGVVLTQAALKANAKMSIQAHDLRPDDTVLNVLPLFHVGGLNILPTPAFSIGATVLLHKIFDPVAMIEDLGRAQAAITVPTVLAAVMAQPEWDRADLSHLRVLSIGSTDVPRSMIDAVHTREVPVVQIYGATETSPLAIYQTPDTAMATAGSIGRTGCACQIRLVGPDGIDVKNDMAGEVWVKGDNTVHSYWHDPALTAASVDQGWYKTGDMARRDTAGNYWFADRLKHIIISGGENIYPAEIERVLRTHPAVKEVAVVGQADAKWGETPVAVIVADEAIAQAEILQFLQGKLARYKLPSRVVSVNALPRNAMGKVVAADVKQMLAGL